MLATTGTGELREALTPSKPQLIYPQWCLLVPAGEGEELEDVGQTLQDDAWFCSRCCGQRFGFYKSQDPL